MGFFFSIKDANVVAYLTDPGRPRPPRLTGFQLSNFVGAIAHGGDQRVFVSSDPVAAEEVRGEAARTLAELQRAGKSWD